jgi:predicted DNA-binding transcriptional regulator YafY
VGRTMNKTDRMLAILLELQRRNPQRAEDLAAVFETSVRTIYRDMQALSEAGVPIVGEPGKGYSLMEGYFLPPISFTPGESVAILMGADFIGMRFDSDYAAHAERAKAKISAVLPPSVREEADQIRSAMKLLKSGAPPLAAGSQGETLKLLRRAVLDSHKVVFRYRKNSRNADEEAETIRTVYPYGLVLVNGAWILVAHCGLRQAIRHFRLSRMSELELTEGTFTRPTGFDLTRYSPPDDRNVWVRVLAEAPIAERVRESGNFFLDEVVDHEEGAVMSFRVRKPEELLPAVMSWGAGAVVLEPEELRVRVREEILKMAERY